MRITDTWSVNTRLQQQPACVTMEIDVGPEWPCWTCNTCGIISWRLKYLLTSCPVNKKKISQSLSLSWWMLLHASIFLQQYPYAFAAAWRCTLCLALLLASNTNMWADMQRGVRSVCVCVVLCVWLVTTPSVGRDSWRAPGATVAGSPLSRWLSDRQTDSAYVSFCSIWRFSR